MGIFVDFSLWKFYSVKPMDYSDFMENSICLQRVMKGFKMFCSCCLRILLRLCGNVDAHALYKENKKVKTLNCWFSNLVCIQSLPVQPMIDCYFNHSTVNVLKFPNRPRQTA